jgi:hypothetical protein
MPTVYQNRPPSPVVFGKRSFTRQALGQSKQGVPLSVHLQRLRPRRIESKGKPNVSRLQSPAVPSR